MRIEWLLCPICKSKTRLQLREDTELKNFPLYCPKCKQETLINAMNIYAHSTREAKRTSARLLDKVVGGE
ncbi:cysteine-rich KTR domain-containing protein [Blautia producta]|jgi:uncharacterized protein YbaR (Trm112 family)|uniref:cysteine-rich KTR domain-containing protein n=1 Tax=Blautia producta TaxID=33035 RepID=UPI00356B0C25